MSGILGRFLLGGGARDLTDSAGRMVEIFRPNATRALELGHEAYSAAHGSHAAEFAHARAGCFDAFVNGLNRLPRPCLALGTMGLFVYAMIDPPSFTRRMQALAQVPEPLWWLLGAVVAFYFGAREAHHLREHRPQRPAAAPPAPRSETPAPPSDNRALRDWQRARDEGNHERD